VPIDTFLSRSYQSNPNRSRQREAGHFIITIPAEPIASVNTKAPLTRTRNPGQFRTSLDTLERGDSVTGYRAGCKDAFAVGWTDRLLSSFAASRVTS
jgi:hypothetical protein